MAKKAIARLEGIRDVERALAKHGRMILDAVADAIADGAEAVRSDAVAGAPWDTGQLAEGIDVEYSARGLVAEVGERDPTRTHVAEFHEHGTSSIPAQPFMRPAAERERKKAPGRVEKAVATKLGRS